MSAEKSKVPNGPEQIPEPKSRADQLRGVMEANPKLLAAVREATQGAIRAGWRGAEASSPADLGTYSPPPTKPTEQEAPASREQFRQKQGTEVGHPAAGYGNAGIEQSDNQAVALDSSTPARVAEKGTVDPAATAAKHLGRAPVVPSAPPEMQQVVANAQKQLGEIAHRQKAMGVTIEASKPGHVRPSETTAQKSRGEQERSR